jgi:hypothetical protein
MPIKRPRRADYASEPDFLIACLKYLDAKFPGREGQRQRVAKWRRMSERHDADVLRDRIRELVMLDTPFTDAEEVEFLELVADWHRAKQGKTTTQQKRSTK